MTTLTLYGLKNCDTCKKALSALNDAGHDITFIDVRDQADLKTKVPLWLAEAGADQLVNKRSTTWRNLTEVQKSSVESGKAADLLIENPTLIKRPVIETDKTLLISWSKIVSQALT